LVTTDNQADTTIRELYILTSPIKLLAILDEYEEYFANDNVNSVFIRNTIDINFEGKKVESYAYEFNRSVEGLKEIVGGDFMGR
jgi:pyruvate carboxylase